NKKVWDKITIAGLGRQTPFKHLAYANNYLFIGYDNGIIVYNQKTTAYEFITTQNGLLDNYIYDMMISCDHLWIIGPKGLARFQFTNIYKNND
ncbi:MAG: hypothetical protein N2748_05230, partial [candidate division WOR-3 bacterium]|nr:hypothetical protein [candidate division WOR-3 bacterium]